MHKEIMAAVGVFIIAVGSAMASAPTDAMREVRLEAGGRGNCIQFQENVDIRNLNTERSIRATVNYRTSQGIEHSLGVALRPGEVKKRIIPCSWGRAWIAGAEYI